MSREISRERERERERERGDEIHESELKYSRG
jgi:hypothetical protein